MQDSEVGQKHSDDLQKRDCFPFSFKTTNCLTQKLTIGVHLKKLTFVLLLVSFSLTQAICWLGRKQHNDCAASALKMIPM